MKGSFKGDQAADGTVSIYNSGDLYGAVLANLITPTVAVVTGGLAIGRISFATWWE